MGGAHAERAVVPLILVLGLLVALAFAWQKPALRSAIQKRPGEIFFWALFTTAIVLVSFRAGRQWLALLAITVLVWGRRLFPLISRLGRPSAANRPSTPSGSSDRMTRAEALEVLGLGEDASAEEIQLRYRTLMKSIHPDRGGSAYLAKRVNAAKRVLLDT